MESQKGDKIRDGRTADGNAKPPTSKEHQDKADPYDEKFKELQKYVPFLKGMIKKLEASSDKVRDAQLVKMKNLFALLTTPKKRMKLDTLEKCEDVLKKLVEKLKHPNPDNSSNVVKKVKVEKEVCMESPASPPKPDLTPPKYVPKIIPVERCATVERDFTNVEEPPSLEVSRERLKGIINANLKKDLSELPTPTPPASSPSSRTPLSSVTPIQPPSTYTQIPQQQIPGLDMVFSSEPGDLSSNPSVQRADFLDSKREKSPPVEEWRRLDNANRGRGSDSDISRNKTDDWHQTQNTEGLQLGRDLDERCIVSPRLDSRSGQSQSVMVHPPLFPLPLPSSHKPGLLAHQLPHQSAPVSVPKVSPQDKHTPRSRWSAESSGSPNESHQTRRSWLPESSVMGEEVGSQRARWGDEPVRDVHLPRGSWVVGSNSQDFPQPSGRAGEQSAPSRVQSHRSSYDADVSSYTSWRPDTLTSPKDVPSSRKSWAPETSVPKFSAGPGEAHTSRPSSASAARSLREKLGQDIDKVEKLGRSTGGALRALKSDPRFSRREDVPDRGREVETLVNEDLRLSEVNSRARGTVRDPRRNSLDDQPSRSRADPRIQRDGLPVAHTMPSALNQSSHYGAPTNQQDQWTHSRMSFPSTRTSVYQSGRTLLPTPGGSTVIQSTFHWQSTCTVKQTTAHALGYRYQPRNKQTVDRNRSSRGGDERSMDSRGDRRDSKDGTDRNPRKKESGRDRCQAEEEFSSPLNSLYDDKKASKPGQRYGIQNYKIPKLNKAASPPKDQGPFQLTMRPSDPRVAVSRDPRLARSVSRPPSPDPPAEFSAFDTLLGSTPKPCDHLKDSIPEGIATHLEKGVLPVSGVSRDKSPEIDGQAPHYSAETSSPQRSAFQESSSRPGATARSPLRDEARSRSRSPSDRFTTKSRGGRSRSRSRAKSRARSSSRSRAKSRARSPSQSRGASRGRSTSRSRAKSRGRSRSNSRASSRAKSRGRSTSRSRAKSRGRSTSRSRGRSRGRSISRSRAKSRGRSTSRSRARSRGRSPSRSRAKSRGRSSSRCRAKSRGRSTSHSRAKSRGRSTSQSRGRSRGRSISRSRAKSRGRSSSRSRAKSRGRSSSRSRAKSRGRSASRTRAKSRARRSRSRSRRSVSNSRAKSRGRSSVRSVSRGRSSSRAESMPGSPIRSVSGDIVTSSKEDSKSKSISRPLEKPRPRSRSRSRCKSRAKSISSDRSSSQCSSRSKVNKSEGKRKSRDRSIDSEYKSETGNESPLGDRRRTRGRSRTRRSDRYDQRRRRSESRSGSEVSRKNRGRKRSYEKPHRRNRSNNDGRSSRRYSNRASSISSFHSSSDRSNSSSFKQGRSRSRSPSRELAPPLTQKNEPDTKLTTTSLSSDVYLPIQKEVVESSSVSQNSSSAEVNSSISDSMMDVPTSTSENISDTPCLELASDSLNVNIDETSRNTPSPPLLKPESSFVNVPSKSVDASNTIFEILKQALAEPESLIAFATRTLPEDKRAKVLEIFKEAGSSVELPVAKQTANEKPDETERDSAVSRKTCKASKKIKKGICIKPDASQKKVAVKSPEGMEKQPKTKKRNELEKLHEDIREMFISKDVVTATGQRSCRIRKEGKPSVPVPSAQLSTSEEKVRKGKERGDDITDTEGSSLKPHCLNEENVSSEKSHLISSESDNDDAFDRLKLESRDNSPLMVKRKRKMRFPESDSESDLDIGNVEPSSDPYISPTPRQPLIVLEKADVSFPDVKSPGECRTISRNVARRGRKVGSLTRDHKRVKQEVTISYPDKEADIDLIERARIEDKDMSLIDTSNIIQVEHYGSKLTRNQLKLLKGPDVKFDPSRISFDSDKESPEDELEVPKAHYSEKKVSESSPTDDLSLTPHPVKRKKRVKRLSSWQKGVAKKKKTGTLIKAESLELPLGQDHLEDINMEQDSNQNPNDIKDAKETNDQIEDNVINPDISGHSDLNYYTFLKEKTQCKLCPFIGKNIVHHFVSKHSNHEVYPSRLPSDLAENVKSQSSQYNGKTTEELQKEYAVPSNSVFFLKCAVCCAKLSGTARFFDHASTHTGEFRYGCKMCSFKAACRKSVKHHMLNNHSTSSAGPCKILCTGPPSMSVLFGYLCSVCNFFQLEEGNLKAHLKLFHADSPIAQSIRFCIGQQVSESSQVSLISEETSSTASLSLDGSQDVEMAENNKQNLVQLDSSSTPKKTRRASEQFPDCDHLKDKEDNASILPEMISSNFSKEPMKEREHPSPSDLSVFISTKLLDDDESQVNEKREKLLKDAGEKIKDRPKIRSSISDRLALRLQSNEESPSNISSTDMSKEKAGSLTLQTTKIQNIDALKKDSTTGGRPSLRLTPARLNSKVSDGSERRFTRSLSRNVVSSSDSDSSSIPDEMKAPLPASMLSDTLQRMQETLKDNAVIKQTDTSPSSVPEISSDSHFVTKKKSVRVGFVEAVVVDGSDNLLYLCRSENCVFASTQAILFLKHTKEGHPKIPTLAPCSVCKDQSIRDIPSSFLHLVKKHLFTKRQDKDLDLGVPGASSKPPAAVPLEWSKSSSKPSIIIRPRRLPGDTLSERRTEEAVSKCEGNELPQLVISSVVSLSKDHTPDGTPLEGPAATLSALLQHPPVSSSSDACSSSSDTSVTDKTIRKTTSSCPTPWTGSYNGRSKPFRKDSDCLKKMKTPEKLRHIFKCMGPRCSFSTNVKEKYAEHYERHLSPELRLNPNAASESYEWQRCPYCGDSKVSGETLVDHILIEHWFLKYQCPYCFYRAACQESVVFHVKLDHLGHTLEVLECCPISPEKGKVPTLPSTQLAIQPYRCAQGGECHMKFIAADDLVDHLQSKHTSDPSYRCHMCRSTLNSAERLICHYSSSHQFRMYHCLYCSKAAETKDEISSHMCLDHPEKELIVGARLPRPNVNTTNKLITIAENMPIYAFNLADSASANNPFVLHKYQKGLMDNEETDINIDPVFHNTESVSSIIFSPCVQSKLEGVKSHTSNDRDVVSSKIVQSNQIKLPDSSPEKRDCSINEVVNQNDCNKLYATTKGSDVVDLTGLDLFLCGYSGCSFKAESSSSLRDHLFSCDMSRESPNLCCPHCSRVFKNVLHIMDHLPKHSVLRYKCALCDFAARVPTVAIKHLRQKHKGVTSHQIVPVHPLHRDPDTALYSVRPKDSLAKKVKKAQPLTTNKSMYGPDDVDSLPSRAVFKSDVTCIICNYSTKVRSNMLHHLEQHAQGWEVSPTPVVNPVPKRQAKMFDTMTNHAISSTIPVRRDSNAFRVSDEPKFVPENKRYVCCAPACQYVTSDDTMLRHHIRVLHAEIFFYKCPHCPEPDGESVRQTILLEKLGSHLKMHDSRLYSCVICSYYHYQRHIVERHTAEKHPDQTYIRIIREPKPDGPVDTENVVGLESEIVSCISESQWECGFCETKGTRAEVVSHVASVHRIQAQFKCSHCPYRTNNRSRFPTHFANKHPSMEEDFITVYRKSEKSPSVEANQKQSEAPVPAPPLLAPPTVPQVPFDSTPLWRRDAPRLRHLRGILFDEHGPKPKDVERFEMDSTEVAQKRRSASDIGEGFILQGNKKDKKDDLIKKPVFKPDQNKKASASLFDSEDKTEFQGHLGLQLENSPSTSTSEICETNAALETEFSNLSQCVTDDPVCVSQSSDNAVCFEYTIQTQKNMGRLSPAKRKLSTRPVAKLEGSPIRSPKSVGSSNKSPQKSTLAPLHEQKSPPMKVPHPKSILKPPLLRIATPPPPPTFSSNTPTFTFLSPIPTSKPQSNEGSPGRACVKQTDKCNSKATTPAKQAVVESNEGELIIDESAYEMDIEEVEESEDSRSAPSSSEGGFPCKYKQVVGCNSICKSRWEANYHEMKHWKIKPFRCGYCEFTAVQKSVIKLHTRKRHSTMDYIVLENELPAEPTILPIQQKRKSESTKERQSINPSVSQEELNENERLFRNVKVYRCLHCRLRETSLSRLLLHWRYNHRDQEGFQEDAPDGRKIVPFKFKEVKLGNHEKETMAFRCALCMKTGTVKILKEHFSSRHVGKNFEIRGLVHDRLQCALCPRQFSSKLALNTHFVAFHPGETTRTSKVMKPSDLDASGKLDAVFGCLYCLEHVITETEMVDHHLKFHSHLEPKYIEMDDSESEFQEMGDSTGNTSDQYVSKDLERPSTSNSQVHNEQPHTAHDKALSDIDRSKSDSSVQRRVARKSTAKFRAVARKSTGGNIRRPVAKLELDSESSDIDSVEMGFSFYGVPEDKVDVKKISCPVMFDGIMSRVNLATMSQFSNLYPVVVLKDMKKGGNLDEQNN